MDEFKPIPTYEDLGRPTLKPTNPYSNKPRPFELALKQYKKILSDSINNAINEIEQHPPNSLSYSRIMLDLIRTFVEIEIQDSNNDPITRRYALHELHYGPINNSLVKSLVYDESATDDFIKATNFTFRDSSIWLKVNYRGKNLGGDGSGFCGTACSIFRDYQIECKNKGYYLVDFSKHRFDENRNKWVYKVDIRLYKTLEAVKPQKLWHQYGVIPGLGKIISQEKLETLKSPQYNSFESAFANSK